MVACGELSGDGIVLLNQGAARNLGRVRGQYQFDLQLGNFAGKKRLIEAF